jgi:hypothetical protein
MNQASGKSKTYLEAVFWGLLLAAGLMALARWFHPALFSANTLVLLVVLSVTSLVLVLGRS